MWALRRAGRVLDVSTSDRQPRRIEVPHEPRRWYRFRTVDGATYDVLAPGDDERTWDQVEAQLRAWGVNTTIVAVGYIDQPGPLPAEIPGSLTIEDHLDPKDTES